MRNIPPDPDESISELVEHFFLVNHPGHYLTHQVIIIYNIIHEYSCYDPLFYSRSLSMDSPPCSMVLVFLCLYRCMFHNFG